MKKLILIDGNAILHRAYHALPSSLTTPDGQPVNAVYGFFSMFIKILEDQRPEHIIVCFDRAKPTFRQELFAGYHENRPQMADDLVPQVIIIHEVLKKMNVEIFEVDGYEADDLIGTLAVQAARINTNTTNIKSQISSKSGKDIDSFEIGNLKLEILIVTGDRDMLQLVNGHVKVLMPILGITNMTLMDEKAVEAKYGVKPSQFIDYKALIGDASDNYPGVSGIGPKTASALLREYGTFEALYQQLDKLSAKIAGLLATDAEQAALAKKLATILTDAPITFDKKKCATSQFNIEAGREAFEALGIKSLQKRLALLSGKEEAQKKQKKSVDTGQLGLLD